MKRVHFRQHERVTSYVKACKRMWPQPMGQNGYAGHSQNVGPRMAGGPETLSGDPGGQNDCRNNTKTLTAFSLTFALMGKTAASLAPITGAAPHHGHTHLQR